MIRSVITQKEQQKLNTIERNVFGPVKAEQKIWKLQKNLMEKNNKNNFHGTNKIAGTSVWITGINSTIRTVM